MKTCQHFCSWTVILLILQLHWSNTTFDVYISNSQLNSYFIGTEYSDKVKDHSVYIIRDGMSVVQENGSLQLEKEEDILGSGSLAMIPTSSPQQKLPPLPSNIDEVAFTWRADAPVTYQLSFTENPEGYNATANVSLSDYIPREETVFSVNFPCNPSVSGTVQLLVNLTTNITSSGETMRTSFLVEKYCEVKPATSVSVPVSFTSFPGTTVMTQSILAMTTVENFATPLFSTPTVTASLFSITTSDLISPTSSITDGLLRPYTSSLSVTSLSLITSPSTLLMPSSSTSFIPSPFTSLKPSSSTSLKPSPSTSLTPSPSTSLKPSSSTSFKPSPSTSLTPSPFTSLKPSSSTSLKPSPSTSLEHLPSTSLTPSPSTSLKPLPSTSFIPLPSKPSPSTSLEPLPFTSFIPLPSTSLKPSSPIPSLISSFTISQTIPSSSMSVVTNSSSVIPTGSASTTEMTATTEDPQFLTLAIIVFGPVVCVLVISICLVCCSICCCLVCCKKTKTRKYFNDDPSDLPVRTVLSDNYLYPAALELSEKKDEIPITLWMSLAWGSVCNLPAGVQGVIKRYSMDRKCLNILTTTSRGDYGCIVNGQLNIEQAGVVTGNKGVMMKMNIGFQKQYGHRDEITKFLECATLMRGMEHPNILSILGVSVEDDYVPIVVYPIMEYGNLHQFLALCRMAPGDSPLSPVTLQHKVTFSYQIVSGMKFLSENGIVHPDLALRNCYMDTNYQVKISDGALSQCFFPECYHTIRGTVRSVRWAALETLQEGLCTSQSNVWSFGVTIWEVMTLGRLPYYDEVDHNRGVLTHLLLQNRLSRPQNCPDNIYSLMTECWKQLAESRPNFKTLHSLIYEIYNTYAAIQNTGRSTTHEFNDISYSTFGKDLRSHDINPAEFTTNMESAYYRKMKSGGSLRNSVAQSSPSTSQRESQRLSLTFSVLSNENEVDPSSGSEAEGPVNLNFEIPSFKVPRDFNDIYLGPSSVNTNRNHYQAESPLDMVSTFLPVTRPPHISRESPSTSSLTTIGNLPSAPQTPSTTAPTPTTHPTTPLTPCETTSFYSTPKTPGPLHNNGDSMPHSQFSTSTSPDVPLPVVSVTQDSPVSKPSTLDSINTSTTSGPHSVQPTSHIPGIPGSTYNNTSVSIEDVQLRNRTLLNANGHDRTNTSLISSTPSGASKSDSGIRSDEEIDSVLYNGGQMDKRLPLEMKVSVGSVENRDSVTSAGISDLSNDLMATFASWGVRKN